MKSYYGGRIGTHQRYFERYHPDLLRPPLPWDWGFAIPTQNCNLDLRNGLQIWPIYSQWRFIRTKAH